MEQLLPIAAQEKKRCPGRSIRGRDGVYQRNDDGAASKTFRLQIRKQRPDRPRVYRDQVAQNSLKTRMGTPGWSHPREFVVTAVFSGATRGLCPASMTGEEQRSPGGSRTFSPTFLRERDRRENFGIFSGF